MDIFTDEFLAFLELKQDLLYHKIPPEKISYFVRESLAFGENCARKSFTKDMLKLYSQSNIRIQKEKHDGIFFKVEMRAQFESDRKGNNLVYLYQASIKKLAKASNLSIENMTNIILAHEYFHYLESHNQQHVSEMLDSIITMKIMGITRKASIGRTSEIAANAFAKKMLGLEHLPSYYDYQYLLKEKKVTYSDLEEEYQDYLKVV